jgi:signal peptidase I
MNILKKLPITIVSTLLFIIFPFIVFTLISSRTAYVFGIRSFAVLTGSMTPLFPVGSMIYSKPQGVYEIHDIITFKDKGGKVVTHRVVGKETKNKQVFYTTKGDANNAPDSGQVSASQILGKVFFFVPYLGLLIGYLKTPLYFVAVIVVPTIVFVGIELWNIKREIERMTEKRVLERLQKQQV